MLCLTISDPAETIDPLSLRTALRGSRAVAFMQALYQI